MAVLLLLAFVYGVELAQAVFLLGFPLRSWRLLNLRMAARIRRKARGALVRSGWRGCGADPGHRHGLDFRDLALGHVPEPFGRVPRLTTGAIRAI